MVIDLHSLYETNLLGFLAGAKHRLYANRENRSLDFLANFEPKPPRENKKLHLTDGYLNVLQSLGIENAARKLNINPPLLDSEKIETLFGAFKGEKIVGIFPGAGNVSRRWSLKNFAALAENFSHLENLQTMVFLGPEETDLRGEIEKKFPPETVIVDNLSLTEFVAALAKTAVLVSNDTGAVHLAALVATPIVLVMDSRAPTTFLPLTDKIRVVNYAALDEVGVSEVSQAARELIEK